MRPLLLLLAASCGLACIEPAFAADGAPPAPRPAGATPAPASLSAGQLKKLDNLLADDGVDQLVPPVILARLGLSQRVIKQLGVVDKTTSDLHAYARLRDGGVLFTFVDYAKTRLAYTYRLDPSFKVIASVAMAKAGGADIADPETGAKAELAYWAQVADQL
ncbi:MAG TPA: hypothetical protein VGL73_12035 [Caulobacteraceae bacterium]|jgi:hypothetical protein